MNFFQQSSENSEMTEIKIALGTDQNYIRYAGTLMTSILVNAKPDERITFYIIDGGISADGKQQIDSLQSIRPFEVQYFTPDMRSYLKDCPDVSYYSMNAYSRLLLPELLPNENRVLYLDCDMIVDGSLAELWKTDLSDISLGVAIDTDHIVRRNSRYYQRLHLTSGWSFNSGMLLINLEKIRQQGLFQKTIHWIVDHRAILKCPDQDALNVVFENDKKKVSIRYNFIHKWNLTPFISSKTLEKIRKVNPDFAESMTHPIITHFIGPNKPDNYSFTGNGELFWKYLKMTPWKDRQPSEPRSFREQIVKNMKRSFPVRWVRLQNRVKKLISKKID